MAEISAGRQTSPLAELVGVRVEDLRCLSAFQRAAKASYFSNLIINNYSRPKVLFLSSALLLIPLLILYLWPVMLFVKAS